MAANRLDRIIDFGVGLQQEEYEFVEFGFEDMRDHDIML